MCNAYSSSSQDLHQHLSPMAPFTEQNPTLSKFQVHNRLSLSHPLLPISSLSLFGSPESLPFPVSCFFSFSLSEKEDGHHGRCCYFFPGTALFPPRSAPPPRDQGRAATILSISARVRQKKMT